MQIKKYLYRVDLIRTNFAHETAIAKRLVLGLMGNLGVSRQLNINYPVITPRASVSITNYSLKNSPNINRTILGSGVNIDFTVKRKGNLFGSEISHRTFSYNFI